MKWLWASLGLIGAKAAVQESGPGRQYRGDDPALLEAMRRSLTGDEAKARLLANGALNRAIRLHVETIGMLPLNLLHRDDSKGKATEHPVFSVLQRKPNNWQTPYEFKRLMHASLLNQGVAYAQIVRSMGRVIQLQPLAKYRVEAKQGLDWKVSYHLTSPNGVRSVLPQGDVLAIRDLDLTSGVNPSSRIAQAKDAIAMMVSVKTAAQRMFDNNMQVGGALEVSSKLSADARKHLKASMDERTGAENAGKWLLLEEGLKANRFDPTLGDNQQVENLKMQIEEIGRIFGAPRPLLMMDETSWGSGIEALGQFFVTYGLAPQFVNWEQAIGRDLLTDAERDEYEAKFNEGALLRGSKKDQAEVFAKALGAGGHRPWMSVGEVRALSDLPKMEGTDELPAPITAKTGQSNDPSIPA